MEFKLIIYKYYLFLDWDVNELILILVVYISSNVGYCFILFFVMILFNCLFLVWLVWWIVVFENNCIFCVIWFVL